MQEKRFGPIAISIAMRSLAVIVALSFFATLIPIGSAFAANSATKACCIGKAAGHCESGIIARKRRTPPPKREVLCGLKTAHHHEVVTIVADSSDNEQPHQHSSASTSETTSSRPAAESAAVRKPCHTDCCAGSVSAARQQKRERANIAGITRQHPPALIALRFETNTPRFAANENFAQTSPRGPPTFLL